MLKIKDRVITIVNRFLSGFAAIMTPASRALQRIPVQANPIRRRR